MCLAILKSSLRFLIIINPRSVQSSPPQLFLRLLSPLWQLGASIMTLYRARGDQIKLYGLPAFGLAVVPYAVMSLLNLVGTLMLPEYPALYLIESEIMHEATSRGSHFSCVV